MLSSKRGRDYGSGLLLVYFSVLCGKSEPAAALPCASNASG